MEEAISKLKPYLFQDGVKLYNQKLKQIIVDFDFNIITNEYLSLSIINSLKNESQIIIIDKINDCFERDYFVICFDQQIFLIDPSNLHQIQNFFLLNKNSIVYFLSNSKSDFTKIIENEFNKLIEADDDFIEEIGSFKKELLKQKHDNCISKLWSKLIPSISGYLIKKSYSKLKNKTSDFLLTEDEKTKVQEKNIDQDDYIILRNLGLGSNNIVRLIYHIDKGQLFALKKQQGQSNCISIQNREIANYKNIDHPFLPKYICNAYDQGVKCIVTEFIDGLSLLELKHLENNEKIKIIFNILIVIEYLHSKNYIYRDLKMNNVMIDHNKTAILIDFDRMRNLDDITTNVTLDFGHNFIAPEALDGKLSCACDIYSIGILIYYILTIEFQNDDNSNFENDYDEFSNIPSEFSEFKEICKKCTNKDPLKRPKISELIDEFYDKFYSKIHISSLFSEFTTNLECFSEKSTIMSVKDIHTEKFNKYWISLSEYNNPIAQFYLGFMYFNNEMIPRNPYKAFYYIFLSARSNYVRAFHVLGCIYYTGEIVKKNIEKSIFYFTKAADMNYVKSQFNLAQIYDIGSDVSRNINKAIHYYSLADKQNYPVAQLELGKIYYYDKKDLVKAFNIFTKAANQGIIESHHYLGAMYYKGEHVEKNIDKAISHFLITSNEHIGSLLNLGLIYLENKKDIDKAIYYYTIAADNGNVIAQNKLGVIFANIEYGRIDTNKAIKYFASAANKGDITSQMNLGTIYLNGRNVNIDIDKAIKYYSLAANQANKEYSPIAQLELGKIYIKFKNQIDISINYLTQSASNGNNEALCQLGIIFSDDKYNKKDINKAVYYLEMASKSNHPKAQYLLGLIYYYNDNYNKKNINKALNYFDQAAKSNHSEALFMLGVIYHNSNRVPVDIKKAIHYYNKAAQFNNIKAINNLGMIYIDDKLGNKDITKALYYFELAAKQNSKVALTNIGLIYMNNKNKSRNVQKAVSYLTKAAELGDYYAQYYLGTIYLNEKFEMQNINKSIHYFTSSAQHNFDKAQLNLGSIYLNNTYVKRNIKKSLKYFYSAYKNGNVNAMCDLGYFYHEGKYIQQDINEAIKYYKQASSFNSIYAKYYKQA